MKFSCVNMDNWERRECFEHFIKETGCLLFYKNVEKVINNQQKYLVFKNGAII